MIKNIKRSDATVPTEMLELDSTAHPSKSVFFDRFLKTNLFETMKDYKKDCPIAYLRPRGSLQLILDPDEPISGLLMRDRRYFIKELKVRGLGFSNMREAKFATMSMLFGLHRENNDGNLYYCNVCRSVITTRWKCNVCADFYLCPDCYLTNDHPHFMLYYGPSSRKPLELQPVSVDSYTFTPCFISEFTHASRCRMSNCKFAFCYITKSVYNHYVSCQQHSNSPCSLCKQVGNRINLHTTQCKNRCCPVPFCKSCKLRPDASPTEFHQDVSSAYVVPSPCCPGSSQIHDQDPENAASNRACTFQKHNNSTV